MHAHDKKKQYEKLKNNQRLTWIELKTALEIEWLSEEKKLWQVENYTALFQRYFIHSF